MNNLTAVSQQISGLVADNRTQLKPALDKLNGVLEHPGQPQAGTAAHAVPAAAVRDVVRRGARLRARSSRRRWSTSLPGQFAQPFIDAAFSDLGLDPNVLLPSRTRRPRGRSARHTRTAGALPADRPGRRTASDSARRDHRQPRRSGMRSAGMPLPGPPAAIPTASRCPRRRPVGRRRGRPRSGPRPVSSRRRRSGRRCRRPRTGGSEHADRPCTLRIALAAQPGRHPGRRDHRGGHAVVEPRRQGHLRRVLRQRQRPVHRRRGPHPRRRGRHGRRDRPAAERARRSPSPSTREYPVPADVAGGDPVAVAGQRAGDPARPRLLRRPETRCRARSFRRTAPRCPSSGTTSADSWRS